MTEMSTKNQLNNKRVKRNLHTHTYRCKHAKGDVSDYCEYAVKYGLVELGISDHAPLPDNRWEFMRMNLLELNDYSKKISMAQVEYDEIKLYKGMECDYNSDYMSFYEDTLLGDYRFDYLIGSVHWFPHNGDLISINDGPRTGPELYSYINYLIQAISTGKFLFIAHPDIFYKRYRSWDENCEASCRDLLAAASNNDTPLEINGLGFRKPKINDGKTWRRPYPSNEFWALAAEFNISVVINSDAHRPKDIIANIGDGIELAEKYDLQQAEIKLISGNL